MKASPLLGYPALAASDAGDYLAVWKDMASGSRDIHGQMLAASGTLSGTLLTVSDATSGQTNGTFMAR